MEKRIPVDQAQALVTKALQANGVSETNARSVARALVAAEVDGQAGHGFSRVAAYAAQARSGKVDGTVSPGVERVGSAFIRVDARNGFAYPAIERAIAELAAIAPEAGIAAAAISNSHHCGQLGLHVETLAKHGFLALMVANAPKAMAPWGGRSALFGTNPIAFAAPRKSGPPLVIDLSLSKVARGKVMAASKRGETIPDDWALDPAGNVTTDPDAALAGTMLPMGDSKGAALALIVEILAATLTGSNHSFEASSFFDSDGPPPGVGQFLIVLNPGCMPNLAFVERLDDLIEAIERQEGARLPGARRLSARTECDRLGGVVMPAHLLRDIEGASRPA